MQTAKYWIDQLQLRKHPEGGWFKEVYRAKDTFNTNTGIRNTSTSIYYLLEGNDFSAFHKINSDELWHFYVGNSAVEVLWIKDGILNKGKVGSNPEWDERFQLLVPKNCWFAARLVDKNGFALVGCTVSPGFDFSDFELANEGLTEEYPEIADQIKSLIR